MGLNYSSALFLIGEKRRGINFSETLTLGRQGIYMNAHEYHKVKSLLDSSDFSTHSYADQFFRILGATALDFMDASSYEGASILHDLNNPLPSKHHGKWSIVFDGGTLEHVFNFPEAIRSCMAAVKNGGHFITITPWNNFAGHGFYQFSPELFFRIFCPENGFIIERMLIFSKHKWYSIKDPNIIKSRVEYHGNEETLLHICAKKINQTTPFRNPPHQSDYSDIWNKSQKLPSSENIQSFPSRDFSLLNGLREKWRRLKRSYLHPIMPQWAQPVTTKNNIPL